MRPMITACVLATSVLALVPIIAACGGDATDDGVPAASEAAASTPSEEPAESETPSASPSEATGEPATAVATAACDLLTAADAEAVLGTPVELSPANQSIEQDGVSLSTCGYSSPGLNKGGSVTLLVRRSDADDARAAWDAAREATDDEVDVDDYGVEAYESEGVAQVALLGGDASNLDLARDLAAIVAPRL